MTGIVVPVDGTVISLMEVDISSMDDIKAGAFVANTMNRKDEVVYWFLLSPFLAAEDRQRPVSDIRE